MSVNKQDPVIRETVWKEEEWVVEDRVVECIHCCEQPCVWFTKKEDM
jgi:hypothetical protein